MENISENWLLRNLSQSAIFVENRWRPLTANISEKIIGKDYGFISDLRQLTVSIQTDAGELIDKNFVLKIPAYADEKRRMVDEYMGFSVREANIYSGFLNDIRNLAAERKVHGSAVPQIPRTVIANPENPTLLVMEDLSEENYKNIPFHQGLSFDEAKLAVANLAAFHAAGIALKQHIPNQDFQAKYPILLRPKPDDPIHEMTIKSTFNKLIEYIDTLPGEEDLVTWLKQSVPSPKDLIDFLEPRQPLATIIHADSSIINYLFRMDSQSGLPVSCKLIDFQVCMYSNPSVDLAFLLFSSLEPGIRRTYQEELVQHYLDYLLTTLEQYGDFGTVLEDLRIAFRNEWDLSQKFGFVHLVMCGNNWFFGQFESIPTKNRLIEVARDIKKLFPK